MSATKINIDISEFWKDSEYARMNFTASSATDAEIKTIESLLGYKLPQSYIEFMHIQNGGIPNNTAHRVNEPTSWAEDHVAITGIYSIGKERRYSLCGEFGSKFWINAWGYPDIGIYFADCPSAGHDMICLDYSECGPTGEPTVVHVDQESDFKITMIAENFASFINGLEDEGNFD